jgi:hypothetical protein
MGLFAAMLTYLVSAALLVGGMVSAIALFFAKPSDSVTAERPRPPLIRAADRQAAEALKAAPATPQSTAAAPSVSAANRPPAAPPQLKAAESAKPLAGQPARKKKAAKSATSPATAPSSPRDDNSATLGYSPSEQPRKFVFPLDPDW